ncbi:MAG: hypothetical protein JXQ71_12860 [Verrucomicrobia bacterium]|nr:hypothetical protein [Verrucomicrobiota bacterium]
MTDKVFEGFLERQREQGMALARESDLLVLHPLDPAPGQHYLAEFHCRGLVRRANGQVLEATQFGVGIWFPPDYLRRAAVPEVLTWLGPHNAWHPNVLGTYVCPGHLEPGTSLVDLLYQLFEIIVYVKWNPRENDALNRVACAWARSHKSMFPIDLRPLKRVRRAVTPSPKVNS